MLCLHKLSPNINLYKKRFNKQIIKSQYKSISALKFFSTFWAHFICYIFREKVGYKNENKLFLDAT